MKPVNAAERTGARRLPSDPVNSRTDRLVGRSLPVILLAGAAMCIFAGWNAFRMNGQSGFPLDDPWIHLQFARNLHDYGAFSYYKNELSTSGSTSPLYTLLLATGFFITSNEFVLSYTLGVACLALSAFVLFKIAQKMPGGNLAASGAAFLLLFEPRLEWVALSGMETTLFLLAILAVWYFYGARKPAALGICAGLAVWIRPDAILFLAVLAIDAIYRRYGVQPVLPARKAVSNRQADIRWLVRAGIIAALICCAYVAFNLWLSGSIFPNTYAAKLAYYSKGGEKFPDEAFTFLTARHLSFFSLFAAIGACSILWSVVKRREHGLLIPLLWSVGLYLAYWRNLPFLYQEGRYLMPVLPFMIMLGLRGVTTVLDIVKKLVRSLSRRKVESLVTGSIIAAFGVQFAVASWNMKDVYADSCRYIGDRQVMAAKWLHEHLPETAVVATHDVGAIAFYSGRRIVDMVGLISPEMIGNFGSLEKLTQYLIRKKVTHLALLRNWFEVVNEDPLLQTDQMHPEIMEVFPFDPARTHFVPGGVGRMTQTAGYYLSKGDARNAIPVLEQALRADPRSSRTHFLMGRAYLHLGDLGKAEGEVRAALRLHPQYWDARATLAEISEGRNRSDEAVTILEDLIRDNPSYANGYRMLARLYASAQRDSVKALQYLERYNRFLREGAQ